MIYPIRTILIIITSGLMVSACLQGPKGKSGSSGGQGPTGAQGAAGTGTSPDIRNHSHDQNGQGITLGGASSGGGNFSNDNSGPLLDEVKRRLSKRIRLSSGEIYKSLPNGWTKEKIAAVIDNIEEQSGPSKRTDAELMFDYDYDHSKKTGNIYATKNFYNTYAGFEFHELTRRADNNGSSDALKGRGLTVNNIMIQILHEVAHLIFAHLEQAKKSDVDIDKDIDDEARSFAKNLLSAIEEDFYLCESDGAIPTWISILDHNLSTKELENHGASNYTKKIWATVQLPHGIIAFHDENRMKDIFFRYASAGNVFSYEVAVEYLKDPKRLARDTCTRNSYLCDNLTRGKPTPLHRRLLNEVSLVNKSLAASKENSSGRDNLKKIGAETDNYKRMATSVMLGLDFHFDDRGNISYLVGDFSENTEVYELIDIIPDEVKGDKPLINFDLATNVDELSFNLGDTASLSYDTAEEPEHRYINENSFELQCETLSKPLELDFIKGPIPQ